MEEGERVDKSPEDLDVNILLPDCGLGYKHQREDLDHPDVDVSDTAIFPGRLRRTPSGRPP